MKYDSQEGFQETDIDRRYEASQEWEANHGYADKDGES